jgi:hypothetical protein
MTFGKHVTSLALAVLIQMELATAATTATKRGFYTSTTFTLPDNPIERWLYL